MISEPACHRRGCIHFEGIVQPGGTELAERPVCKAFPKGIPDSIAYGDNAHTLPYPGDHGIQFEKEKK